MEKKSLYWILFAIAFVLLSVAFFFIFSRYYYSYKSSSATESISRDTISSDFGYTESYTNLSSQITPGNESVKVTKTGSLNLYVVNIDEAITSIKDINNKYKGSIVSLYDSGKDNERTVTIDIKFPIGDFDKVYEEVRNLGSEVVYANVWSNDVAKEYKDIEAKLENLQTVKGRLLNILKGAETVEDTLAVQKEIDSVQGEIDTYEAMKRDIDSQIDYGYLSINFALDKEGLNIFSEEWKPAGEFKAALNALVEMFRDLGSFGIWVLVFSPLVVVPVGVILLVVKFYNKKKA